MVGTKVWHTFGATFSPQKYATLLLACDILSGGTRLAVTRGCRMRRAVAVVIALKVLFLYVGKRQHSFIIHRRTKDSAHCVCVLCDLTGNCTLCVCTGCCAQQCTHMPPHRKLHPVHNSCLCFRCSWRRVHWRFWASLCCLPKNDFCYCSMSFYEDSQVAGQGSYAFEDDCFVPATQPSQAVPDSYAVTSRASLPMVPYASMPPGERAVHDKLKPAFAAMFPNLHRFYDTNSRAIAHISWEWATAEEVWDIVTCKLLGGGRMETMAWFKKTALSHIHALLASYVNMQHDEATKRKVPIPPLVLILFN